ncbi:DUF3802 family protein [Shewanella dokdonensis]|uniref:DUF3802 family protein n=1 Tax=Shewanella dokdonensis TaxID=712036 RepID=A0ABX8DET2_9GAMM|nr:DUF3802 family protein [Shewanella dokdonensis]MCL1076029.1 DUF3802 family protein [Shewanella dokdonensis]QVK23229.1 DUF3802 family protein [Shewanella dokdonensis]
MVTDKEGYAHLIQYLTEHLGLFENAGTGMDGSTVMEMFEDLLAAQIIVVCGQNPELSFAQRNTIIREVDAIMYDLEEILAGCGRQPVNREQSHFITEFTGLVKNLFDQEIEKSLRQ